MDFKFQISDFRFRFYFSFILLPMRAALCYTTSPHQLLQGLPAQLILLLVKVESQGVDSLICIPLSMGIHEILALREAVQAKSMLIICK